MGTLFLLVKNKWIFLRVLSIDDVKTSNRYRKIAGSKISMANFETVKMLAKEVPFLLENVLRIRFYLNSKLY